MNYSQQEKKDAIGRINSILVVYRQFREVSRNRSAAAISNIITHHCAEEIRKVVPSEQMGNCISYIRRVTVAEAWGDVTPLIFALRYASFAFDTWEADFQVDYLTLTTPAQVEERIRYLTRSV